MSENATLKVNLRPEPWPKLPRDAAVVIVDPTMGQGRLVPLGELLSHLEAEIHKRLAAVDEQLSAALKAKQDEFDQAFVDVVEEVAKSADRNLVLVVDEVPEGLSSH